MSFKRKIPWTSQPQYPVRLQNKDGFYYASVAGDKYQDGGRLPGISAGKKVANTHGLAGELVLASAQTTSIAVAVPSGSWSILIDFMPISRAGLYPYMLGISGAANAIAFAWRHDSTAGRAVWYDGTDLRDSGLTFPIGEPAVVGITYNSANTTYSFFKNSAAGGVVAGANTGTGNWQFASATNEGNTTNINLLAFSNQCIPASRMREITAAPHQIFEPLSRNIYVEEAGGVTAALTGQSITAAQGTLSPAIVSSITGQTVNAALGNVSPAVVVDLSGQAVQAAQGSVTAAVDVALTGQAVTAALGDVGVAGDIVRALTGQSVTAFLGSVSVLAEVISVESASNWQDTPKNFLWSRKELEPEEVEIIESLAETQAKDLESTEEERKEQLRKALKLKNIEIELRHIEAINSLRGQVINAEIASLMKIAQIEAENEEYLELLMLAAAA